MIITTKEAGVFLATMTVDAEDLLGRHHEVDHLLLNDWSLTTETDILEPVISMVVIAEQ